MASQEQALGNEWMNYFNPSVHVEAEAPSSAMGPAFDQDHQLFGGAAALDLTPEYPDIAQAIEHIPSFDALFAQTSSFDLENAGAFDESVNLNQSTGQVNANITNGNVYPFDDIFEETGNDLPVDTFVNQNQSTGQVNANITNGNLHPFADLFEDNGNDLPVDTFVDPNLVRDVSAYASSTISGQNLGFTTTVPQAAHPFTTPMAVSPDVDAIVASSMIDPALLALEHDTDFTTVDNFASIDWSKPNLKFSKELHSQISNQVDHELADQFSAPFNEEFIDKLSGYGMPLPKSLRPNSACRSSHIVNSSELRAPAPPMEATQLPVAPPTVAPPLAASPLAASPLAASPLVASPLVAPLAAPTPATPPCAYVAPTPASPVPAAAAHVPGSLAQAHPSSDDGVKWESVWENIGPEDIAHMAACGVGASTKFKSVDEARNSQRRFAHLPEDLTIPRDENTKRTLVACLVRAMASTGNAFDSEKTVQPFLSGRYTTEALEVAAWELVDAMIRRHTDGGSLTTTHLSKPAGRFLDRFLLVRKALTEYKSICKHVLDPLYVHTFVDEPTAAFKRVEANKKVNDRKSGQISAGKKALAGESVQVVTPASTPQRQSSASQLVTPPNTNKRKSSGEEACSKRPRQF